MLFSSMIFLWTFLPTVLVVNGILTFAPFRSERTRILSKNIFLLFASLLFYAWGGIYYLLIMFSSIALNFFGGLLLHHFRDSRAKKKLTLIAVIILNLSMLFFFKYFNMTVVMIESVIEAFSGGPNAFLSMLTMQGTGKLGFPQIVLPIGISFFTFQAMSYVVDVYREKAELQTNVMSFALYVSLFPQLIAGPIVKYSDVALQLNHRKETLDLFLSGQKRFCYGLAKKVLISNTMAQVVDNIWKTDVSTLGTPLAWFGVLAYALQIYYDFSGYSDMAIGVGRMLGFTFKENFDYPYTAMSVAEFWRRWHISLSSWFKEYVYIPLGGNRKGLARTCLNVLIVFFLTGVWHGANFTFLLFGLYYAALQIIERLFLGKLLKKNPIKLLNVLYTLLAVMIGWVLFRAENIYRALDYLGQMFSFTPSGIDAMSHLSMQVLITMVCGILFCGILQRPLKNVYQRISTRIPVMAADLAIQMVLLAGCILMLASGTYNPFIYFQF